MLSEKGVKRIMKEIREYQESKKESFLLSYDETNLQMFYAVVRSMDGEYSGGEYILKIKLPDDYPHSPPVISCDTPNGRFKTGTNICLSISHYHSETWSPLITIEKVIYSVISAFFDKRIKGIGSIDSSPQETKELAQKSAAYNNKYHKDILANIK